MQLQIVRGASGEYICNLKLNRRNENEYGTFFMGNAKSFRA
jgi:hypothetical protein